MRKIIVGTRKSNLALTQTEWVIDQLKKAGVKNEFEIKKIVTKGDQILDVTLSKVGGKGLFVKEIEKAMFDKEIDLAVHSMKDMPAVIPEGLTISSIPEREDHRDAYLAKDNILLQDLPEGAIVGTSSLRRGAQILAERPDLTIKWIRGNIETRIRKLQEEDYDAIILAVSGLKRVGLSEELITEYLEPEVCVPAVGQGALAIESREDDEELTNIVKKIHDAYTAKTVSAERTFLHLLEGGCQVPIGGYAYLDGDEVVLTALVGDPDGTTILKETVRGTEPTEVGKEAAELLISQGAKEIVDRVKEEMDQ
ncbi:hydroxymethylbilane synthase [Oceanobacillus iheyensis]|uniref:Porphobilinogen deaminase n=1 Tax=Oceanobacillus iheyensis (strain DSM 14371 / CIP 107618 / JCM 11309 / KCTC 3954 / HTE831) TaxID=221109 RepID=HEM3_OCEIH|nr:hydroxymethylbilane synthase [Oceanobacillus iheyensis]Q8CXC0.1 RecName: Full=Porphobilinogen deaminase; Short=PBG; AltName: Full=Hydroxymethylbilane synthase; Short=HMBS; AltName: Full=Pre-uroporphyrinogen synthase [Oceanobacillus iheyensis HTE831]BAC14024.1 hydroxymethylbilane synthase (porphobilinogen deaminase) [Oceanobacillus iheyensis HTE831]